MLLPTGKLSCCCSRLLLSDTIPRSCTSCCRISDVGGLCCAADLLLADLSWNDIEQVPQELPATLVSLNLGHNRLANLPATLSALARLPNLRILHLKVTLVKPAPVATYCMHSCTSSDRKASGSSHLKVPLAEAFLQQSTAYTDALASTRKHQPRSAAAVAHVCTTPEDKTMACCAGEPLLPAAFLPVGCAASTAAASAL